MKKISQSLLVAAVVAAAGASASAEVLSPEEALSRALPKARLAAPGLAQPVLAYTAEADELPAVYVFAKENKGFILVAADDAVTPVLGYADSGNFTAENMAPGLKYWIGEYARQIAYARENGIVSEENEATLSRAGRTPIEPLLKTTWNQGAPYNNFCPEGCPTGCVATAAAQVINYHKFPTAALEGEISYTASVLGEPTPLSVDLNGYKFDWDNMLDNYPGATSGTQAQRDAVAKLMQIIGYGVQMNYDEMSGAQTQLVRNLVVERFGYDPSILYLSRECYTLADWEELLYNELAAKRPVLYDGSTINNEGHAFVCDGYMEQDGTPYFHINWGWGGLSDGYFLIDTLDPESQGTGGASSGAGFDYNQNATIHFMPNQGGAWEPQVKASGTGLVLTSSFNMGNDVTVSYAGGGFYNYSYTTLANGMAYGLRVEGEGQSFCRFAAATSSETQPMYGVSSYNVLLSGIQPNSTYIVTPVYRLADDNTKVYDIEMPYGAVRQYVIKTGTYNATATPVGAGLVVSDVAITEQIDRNKYGEMSVKLANDGEFYYYGHVAPAFFEKEYGEYKLFATITSFTINLNPGESTTWEYSRRFTSSNPGLTDGKDYYFGVYNVDTKAIVGPLAKFHYGTVSGIEDVTINEDATPEYFNLQGIRVAEPQAGQVYIVRRGAQVVKELVK